MAATRAHAAGEKNALERVSFLEASLSDNRTQLLGIASQLEEVEFDRDEVLTKYQKLKRQYREE